MPEIRFKPTLKQYLAWEKLQDKTTNYVLFGGAAGGGKSFLICIDALINCIKYPGVKYFIGREELKRLKDSTFLTFYKAARYYNVPSKTFKYQGQEHYLQFANGSRIDLLDLKYLPSDPLYERYGSAEYTGGYIEEGGEVNFAAFDTLKSRIGRCKNDEYNIAEKILITANPKKNWLKKIFVDPAMKKELPENYFYVSALVGDNPYIETNYIKNLESLTDKVKKQRLLFGNWNYEDDDDSIMSYDAITSSFSNTFIKEGIKYMSCDIARYGQDNTVITIWNGWRAEKIITHSKKSIVEITEIINNLRQKHEISIRNIVIDEDGVGGGVVDALRGCIGFVNNSTPIQMLQKKQNFQNLKSQCYFGLAEKINNNEVFINCTQSEQDLITEELQVIKQKNQDSEGKLSIIPREEIKGLIGRSPDFASSLMMRYYFEIQKRPIATFR